MAYPVVQARATGAQTSNSTSHAVTLPSGVTAGDLLVVVFSVDGGPTVTAPAGWTKLGQASNGTTVTGAVFWKLAEGADTLTLTTSASEQSSHVSFRITGAKVVEGSNANGSSTNSDPPLLTPTFGSHEYLWIAARCGDSATVATAAPSGFSNLTTIAGGGQGAATNTAELEAIAASQNPGVFTSATEQWVSWTLAVFSRQASNTFASAYQTLRQVTAEVSAGYAVLAAEAGGSAWFARTTDGYNTWAAYGAAQLVATNTLDAIYSVGGQVSTYFSATYIAGETITGYSLTWFPILTDGYATWAGESVAAGTGIINGGGLLPLSAVNQNYSATYGVQSEVSNFRTALYNVRATITQTFDAEYTANGVVSNWQLVEYGVAQPAVQTFSAGYNVLGIIGSVSNTYSALYRVLASASRGFSASYQVFTTSQVQNTFSGTFNVVAEVGTTFSAGWWVALEPLDPPATFDADYLVYGSVTDSYSAIYQVFERPTATLSAAYSIGVISQGDQVIDVFKYGVEVDR